MPHDLVQRLHDALPQTQCQRCGYPDCKAYAQAIAAGDAPINRCPPGGSEGIARLATITGSPVLALDTSCGQEQARTVVWIDESWCIGCTLCIKACPVDAIIGTNKRMHTVIESDCTGCELCLPACPVDCMHTEIVTGAHTGWAAWSSTQAQQALARYEARTQRLQREERDQTQLRLDKAQHKLDHIQEHSRISDADTLAAKRALIEQAMQKARAKLQR